MTILNSDGVPMSAVGKAVPAQQGLHGHLLDYDEMRGIKRYVRLDPMTGVATVTVTQRVDPVIDQNKAQANDWRGWGARENKNGAIVCRIPDVEYNKIMQRCGFKAGQYDRKKFKQILNDSDYSAFRTGGGRL